MMAEELVLLDSRISGCGMRVRIALAEKGVAYEYREEDLDNKTQLLLQMNPVHKKIPVLIHNGKPIIESMIIVDEVWKDKSPLLPSDPYQRARYRFWAHFIDTKIYVAGRNLWATTGEEREAAKKEFVEGMKMLGEELGDKPYFGVLDVAFIPLSTWFYAYEKCGNFSIDEHGRNLSAWVKRCMEKESVSRSLADPKQVYDFVLDYQKNVNV